MGQERSRAVPESLDVLLLDDCANTLAEMTELLSDLGHRVQTASTVEYAHAHLARQPVDVALLDLRLEGESSLSLLQRLSQTSRESATAPAVIFVTGLDRNVTDSAAQAAENYGFTVLGTLAKPIEVSDLEALVGRLPAIRGVVPSRERPQLTEPRLDAALNGDEIIPVFQPQWDLRTGELVGFETLIRWQPGGDEALQGAHVVEPFFDHPRYSWRIFRSMCIGAIAAIPVLSQVAGRAVTVKVNAVASIFADPRFPADIVTLCEDHGVSPSQLGFELTENDLRLASAVNAGLTEARILDFGVSLDDFGSGAANIQRLAERPFSEVKVDPWFLRLAAQRPHKIELLRCIAAICRESGILSVVEGVESAEMLGIAVTLGFDRAQGYYLGRPEGLEEAARLPGVHPAITPTDDLEQATDRH